MFSFDPRRIRVVWSYVANVAIGALAAGFFIAAPATASRAVDNTAELQSAINELCASGGVLSLPPGWKEITSTITVCRGVILRGAGEYATAIHTDNDIVMLRFTGQGNDFSGLENISVFGPMGWNNLVVVDHNVVVHMRDCRIWGGLFALEHNGMDGTVQNCFISGGHDWHGGNVLSRGANWYIRAKLDTSGQNVMFGFYQAGSDPAFVRENHFTQSDFSGTFAYSVYIADAQAYTVFDGGVFSSPIWVWGAWTNFANAEIGGNITGYEGVLTITGSYGFSGISVHGSAVRVCVGNYRIQC